MTAKNIHYHSDKAASLQTVTGWVSCDGRFFGNDEHLARWAGCTHKTCACGKITSKHYTICDTCREEKRSERYRAMPEGNPGSDMVYSDSGQRYFNDVDDALDYAADEGCSIAGLDLVCCEPAYMKGIDWDLWADDLPEDQMLSECAPKAIIDKLEELNTLIRESKVILSWWPGKERVSDEIISRLQAQLDGDRILLGETSQDA